VILIFIRRYFEGVATKFHKFVIQMLVTSHETMMCNRRVIKEYQDLKENPIPNIKVSFKDNDNLNWYCCIEGLTDEEFVGCQYIFHIKLSQR
jgi:ubiquitin-protein ligase